MAADDIDEPDGEKAGRKGVFSFARGSVLIRCIYDHNTLY